MFRPLHEEKNTLDLLFCNDPNVVHDVCVSPGISDHKIVTAMFTLLQLFPATNETRKVYDYSRANYNEINMGMETAFEAYTEHSYESADCLWNFFKRVLSSLIEKHVPFKYVSDKPNGDKPWMTYEVKRKIKQRSRAYQKYKRNPSTELERRLEELHTAYTEAITTAKDMYCHELL